MTEDGWFCAKLLIPAMLLGALLGYLVAIWVLP